MFPTSFHSFQWVDVSPILIHDVKPPQRLVNRMKIHVIDNSGQITPYLSATAAEIVSFDDEIRALNAVELQQPAIILLNYAQRGSQTPEYVGLLLEASKNSRIIVVGDNISDAAIYGCLMAGAKGYQNCRQLREYIGKMVRVVTEGEAWVSRRLIAGLLDAIRQPTILETLVVA